MFYDIKRKFKLSNETFHLAVNLLDIVFCTFDYEKTVDMKLVAAACFFIASKYSDAYQKVPIIDRYIGCFFKGTSVSEYNAVEKAVYYTVNMYLSNPTSFVFLNNLIDLKSEIFKNKNSPFEDETSKNMQRIAEFLTDLSLTDIKFLQFSCCDIAEASLCLAYYITYNQKLQLDHTSINECQDLFIELLSRIPKQIKMKYKKDYEFASTILRTWNEKRFCFLI